MGKASEGSTAKRAAEAHKPPAREPLRKRTEKMMLCIEFTAGWGTHQLPHQWTGTGYILVYKLLPFLHHLSSFSQANLGTINTQKPFSKEEQCWSNPQEEGLDGAQKAEYSSAALCEAAQGMGSGPRHHQHCQVSLGHGGSWNLAVTVCMVRGVFCCLLQIWRNLSRILPSLNSLLKCSQTPPTYNITNRKRVTWGVAARDRHPSCVGEPKSSSPQPVPASWAAPESPTH